MVRPPRGASARRSPGGQLRAGAECYRTRVPSPASALFLVVDDVFTEGFTIREVAKALIDRGAVEVSEVVLARQPFRG